MSKRVMLRVISFMAVLILLAGAVKAYDAYWNKSVVYINKTAIPGAGFDESYNKTIADKQKAQLKHEQDAIKNKTNMEKAKVDAKANAEKGAAYESD